jgi:hypothetical protein
MIFVKIAERTLLPMNHREFLANRAGRKADGGAEAPALQDRIEKVRGIFGGIACSRFGGLVRLPSETPEAGNQFAEGFFGQGAAAETPSIADEFGGGNFFDGVGGARVVQRAVEKFS